MSAPTYKSNNITLKAVWDGEKQTMCSLLRYCYNIYLYNMLFDIVYCPSAPVPCDSAVNLD